MSNKNYLELAKKLQALAGGGVHGEKENAQKALDALMQKHGITKEELEENKTDWHEFKVGKQYQKLFFQVAMATIGNRGATYRQHRHNQNVIFLEVSIAEQIEIQGKYEFYWHAFKTEQETLLRAFIMRHNLYNIDDDGKTADELTMEELAAAAKAANLARGMEKHEYHKALNAPEN